MNNAPLSIKIQDGRLIIAIGIDTLAFAAENADTCDLFNFKIINKEEFAMDVMTELDYSQENDPTLVQEMLDRAASRAIENGSLAIEEITSEERESRIK